MITAVPGMLEQIHAIAITMYVAERGRAAGVELCHDYSGAQEE